MSEQVSQPAHGFTKIGLLAACAMLFAVAVAVRIMVAVYFGLNDDAVSDEIEYYEPAKSLALGSGYRMVPQQSVDGIPQPTAYRMPGPAVLLSLSFRVFGIQPATARLTCIFFGALSVPLIFLIGLRISSQPAATLSALIAALYPPWVYYAKEILSEPFFVCALLASFLLTYGVPGGGAKRGFVAGCGWGITTLMRPHGLPIAALICALFMWKGRRREAIFLALGTLLPLLAWLFRNVLVMGSAILLATESGETFLGSNNPYVYADPKLHGMWLAPMTVPEYREHLRDVRGEVARSQEQNRLSRAYLRDQPSVVIPLAVRKLTRWLTPLTGSSGFVRYAVLASYIPLVLLLAIGTTRRHYTLDLPLIINLCSTAVFLGVTAVYWGGLIRGRLPLEIIWIPWGGAAAARMLGLDKKIA